MLAVPWCRDSGNEPKTIKTEKRTARASRAEECLFVTRWPGRACACLLRPPAVVMRLLLDACETVLNTEWNTASGDYTARRAETSSQTRNL